MYKTDYSILNKTDDEVDFNSLTFNKYLQMSNENQSQKANKYKTDF